MSLIRGFPLNRSRLTAEGHRNWHRSSPWATCVVQERAAAIAHLWHVHVLPAGWSAPLTAVTDKLLLLAPRIEPPAGFEQRGNHALPSELATRRRRRRLSRRWAPVAAAALDALVPLRRLLADIGGRAEQVVAAAEMRAATGEIVGRSWSTTATRTRCT